MTFNTSKLNKVSAKQICDNFVKAHPDLLEGAVITKIEISGCQGSRRTDKIELSYGGDDITDQKSVSKSEVRWIDIKALSFKSTITSRISTLCSRLCIRYSNMWILPVERMEEFLEEAQEIEREFQAGIQNVVERKMILLNHSGLIWRISFRFHRLVWRGMKHRTFIRNN